mgnify:CR=1 FL=1
MPKIVAEYIDRLINTEMRKLSGSIPRGVTYPLYEAARKAQRDPLTFLAAQCLVDNLKAGDNVIIATGAGDPVALPHGETDGPLGAAALARTLDLAFGAKPILIGEERSMPSTRLCTEAAGLMIADKELFLQRTCLAMAYDYPLGKQAGKEMAEKLLEEHNPKVIITVEKAGPAKSGVYHSITGKGRSPDIMANVSELTDLAMQKGIPVIGIGDGGNEIGFGKIYDAVCEIQPWGAKCNCPCGTGVTTVASADILVSAAVSNWGAYGICAMLAVLLKNEKLLHDSVTEYRMLDAAVKGGAQDGSYTTLSLHVDGISLESDQAILTMLKEMAYHGTTSHTRIF